MVACITMFCEGKLYSCSHFFRFIWHLISPLFIKRKFKTVSSFRLAEITEKLDCVKSGNSAYFLDLYVPTNEILVEIRGVIFVIIMKIWVTLLVDKNSRKWFHV